MKITKREVLFSIAIVAVMITLGFIISDKISNKVMDKNYVCNTAVHITSDEQFKYGMTTNVGNAFVYGDMKANEPVTYDEIGSNYMSVTKVKEVYTMHTRTVTTTDGKGHTSTHMETYWTWDYAGEERKVTEQVTFCNSVLDFSRIKKIDENYITTITHGMTRYKYYGCPIEIKGTLFANLKDNNIEKNAMFIRDKTIDESVKALIESKAVMIFWLCWALLIAVVVGVFYYFDNRWIDG